MLTDRPARSGSTMGDSASTLTVSETAPTDSVKSTSVGADRQREVHFGDGGQAHWRLSNDGLKTGELCADVVGGRRQVRNAIRALVVGDAGELSERFRARKRNGDAGQHGAARVDDL